MKVAVLSIIAVLVSVVLLGVRVLFVKGGRFPDTHIGSNAVLRKKGIVCAHSEGDVSGNAAPRSHSKKINNITNK